MAEHPHPVRGGKQPKIMFGTQPSTAPPTFVLFTSGKLEASYERYIERRLRGEVGFVVTAAGIRLFRVGESAEVPAPALDGLAACQADVALVDLAAEFEVRETELLDRHHFSPYIGRRLRGRVIRTLLRGRTVFLDGKIVSQPAGRLVKPAPSS